MSFLPGRGHLDQNSDPIVVSFISHVPCPDKPSYTSHTAVDNKDSQIVPSRKTINQPYISVCYACSLLQPHAPHQGQAGSGSLCMCGLGWLVHKHCMMHTSGRKAHPKHFVLGEAHLVILCLGKSTLSRPDGGECVC